MSSSWLDAAELRVGLGCMRLSTDEDHDDERGRATILAAAAAGITVFDTARVYGPGEGGAGHNERLLAGAIRDAGLGGSARIVTKGGMTRAAGAWIPDGRGRAIRADCEASLEALGGLPIDLYLLHAPDPRTSWSTSIRALARLRDEGLVARVGLSNVNRSQLEQALDLAEMTAVQVPLSVFDDRPLRGGLLELCEMRGITLMAYSPLGGPRRHGGLARNAALSEVAAANAVTPAEAALAWLLGLSDNVVVIPGARHPEAARSAAGAAALRLSDEGRDALTGAFGRPRGVHARVPADTAAAHRNDEVVVVMGIPGAGKSRVAQEYVARGYTRLNRDELGGTLPAVAALLDERLAGGVRNLVLDNTYLSRAARSHVVEAAARHHVAVRCIWLDTPLAAAQVNLVERLVARGGVLPPPEEIRKLARRQAGIMMPTSQMRALRELEPPAMDEGFVSVERVQFDRAPEPGRRRSGVLVAMTALDKPGWEGAIQSADPTAPHLVFDWHPGEDDDALAAAAGRLTSVVTGPVEYAACRHPAGPPSCWCRPPLPGLSVAFAHAHGVALARATVVGTSATHRAMATALGSPFLPV